MVAKEPIIPSRQLLLFEFITHGLVRALESWNNHNDLACFVGGGPCRLAPPCNFVAYLHAVVSFLVKKSRQGKEASPPGN